jgi:hypothetical protein
MAQFMFLYRRSVQPAASPAQMQQTMQKWTAWLNDLNANGHLKERGLPLETSGSVVGGSPKKNVTDGPYPEKDLVIGFTVVEASDLAKACQLSTGCPIFENGGMVEVRPVMSM